MLQNMCKLIKKIDIWGPRRVCLFLGFPPDDALYSLLVAKEAVSTD